MESALYLQILRVMQMNAHKKEVMPQDVLGRSLAYNCFLPRLSEKSFLYEQLQRKVAPHKALYGDYATWTNMLENSQLEHGLAKDKQAACVIFDDCAAYASDLNDFSSSAHLLDFLSVARRMLPSFLIHSSIFIDGYQILESAIGGADMIVLDIAHIRAFLDCLSVLQSNPALFELETCALAAYIAQQSRAGHSYSKSHIDSQNATLNPNTDSCNKTLNFNTDSHNKALNPNSQSGALNLNTADSQKGDKALNRNSVDLQNGNGGFNSNHRDSQDNANFKALQAQLNQYIAYAYNLGLVPIVRIHSLNDIALLHSLAYFPHCVYATQECMSALPSDCIRFCDDESTLTDVCVLHS